MHGLMLGVAALVCCAVGSTAGAEQIARGVVFEDFDRDGVRDKGEPAQAGVRVSNGRDVVQTDREGRYEIPVDGDDIVFVIKPRGFAYPVDANSVPRFYYVHKPAGSPESDFAGVAPTGSLPESIDFGLWRFNERDRFEMLVFGDPQAYTQQEVDYLAKDIVAEAIGEEARFAAVLGDVVGDDLDLFDATIGAFARLLVPVHYVYGNHDMNFDAPTDELADETWERVFGPTTYSMDVGAVHFIILDDVMWNGGEGLDDKGNYHAELSEEVLSFIESDLEYVKKDQLVVLLMHIPMVEIKNRERLFALLAPFEKTFSMSAHWHKQQHFFFDSEDGWLGDEPHHHWVSATASGSWWKGATSEYGIPHTMMRCGAPNGYSVVRFDGSAYSIEFRGAGKDPAQAMHIWTPDVVDQRGGEAVVNVWNGSELSVVEARLWTGFRPSAWEKLEAVVRVDPYYEAIKALEATDSPPNGPKMPSAQESRHLWRYEIPAGLAPGYYTIEAREVDMFGAEHTWKTVFRVEHALVAP